MRRAHLVPLSTQAVDLLNALKIMTGNYSYAFSGRNDPNKPMSEASINQVIKRIGYGGKITGQGFRHTLSTILHLKDYATVWVEMRLAHTDKNIIRGMYNHAQYFEELRAIMQWYADYLN